jgi:hypothetical protein
MGEHCAGPILTMTDAICPRCGEAHDIIACPNVKAIEFDAEQHIIRVEFLIPVDFHRQDAAAMAAPDNYPKKGPSRT